MEDIPKVRSPGLLLGTRQQAVGSKVSLLINPSEPSQLKLSIQRRQLAAFKLNLHQPILGVIELEDR